MAGQFELLFSVDFTSVASITVTHNLDRLQVAVIVRIGDVARNDLITTVTPLTSDPRNAVVVTLASAQTGTILIVDTDYVFANIPSTENAGVLSGGTPMTADVYDPTTVAADAFARGSHTGTQTASTISDFDTEVGNNTTVVANTAHLSDTTNPHVTDVGNLGSGLLAELNVVITDATLDTSSASRPPSGSAGGSLGGTYPNPTVDDGADGSAIHDDTAGEITVVILKATPVSADVLLIEDSADSNNKKRVTAQSIADLGGGGTHVIACCPFGAKSDGTGEFLIANGRSSDGDDSSKPKTRQPIVVDGTLTRLAYQTKDGDTTTQMKIHVNGSVEQTVVLSSMNANDSGVETISVSVSAGDYVEIEYDAAQKPGECTMYFLQEVA